MKSANSAFKLPSVVLRTTAPPVAVRLLPCASLSWTVIAVVAPLAVMELDAVEICVVAVLAVATLTVTTALSVIAAPLMVPVTVAEPAVVVLSVAL